MAYTLLISAAELAAHLEDPAWIILDARFSLANPDEKEALYRQAHIPGALYVHLDRDLSGPVIPGKTGRHPLPPPEVAAERFGQLGIHPEVQVVVYDDQGGSLAAVRAWWMLRWLGHQAVAVLDGGWQKWLEAGYPLRGGVETRPSANFIPRVNNEGFVDADAVERIRRDPAYLLLDVRAPERYRGEVEPIDPVAGHIPGARNAPYTANLTPEGTFRPPHELRAHYQALFGAIPAERVVFYCGSGVTSLHSVLAVELAGLGKACFYPGSWSEWIADRSRPVAVGDRPE